MLHIRVNNGAFDSGPVGGLEHAKRLPYHGIISACGVDRPGEDLHRYVSICLVVQTNRKGTRHTNLGKQFWMGLDRILVRAILLEVNRHGVYIASRHMGSVELSIPRHVQYNCNCRLYLW